MKNIKGRIAILLAVSMIITGMLPAYAEDLTASERIMIYEECLEESVAVAEEVLADADGMEAAREVPEDTAGESVSENEVSEAAKLEDVSLLGDAGDLIYSAMFSYNGKEYVNYKLNSFKLSDIQNALQITGTVSEASSSNTELFVVDQNMQKTDWTVTVLQAFATSKEKLHIKLEDGTAYAVSVTGLGESMIVTIDAGYGEVTTFRRPHTTDIIANIGQKYPDAIFKYDAVFHRKHYKVKRLYYFTDGHKKETVDKDTIVSKDIKRIYVEWEAEHPATISNILVNGSTYGIQSFVAIGSTSDSDYPVGEGDFLCFAYEREVGEDTVKATIHPADTSLRIDLNRNDGSWYMSMYIKKKQNPVIGRTFDYWMINNRHVEPGMEYTFNLFDPKVDLECYAVCAYDEIDSSVTGGAGHGSYQISYEDGVGSYTITQSNLDLDLFAGREFYYRHNSDHSMEIWFGDDDEICQQHYTIRPVPQSNYAFSSWTINGKTAAVGEKTYIELDDLVSSGNKTLNFNTTYRYNGSPSHGSGNAAPKFTTGTWNSPVSNGTWSFNPAAGTWSYATSQTFCSTWGYIVNPFTTLPNHKADWFYFDQFGNMLTGWQWIKDSDGVTRRYYLYPANTGFGLTGACQIGGVTPDGCTLDFLTGAWTVNGVVQTR